MPNKHSHAFVLSRYESRGYITLPRRSPSPPLLPSRSSHNFRLSTGSSERAPSLNAVPALSSDSSTTSTASSLDEVPPRDLHSASSSVVTEIYAPQSPCFSSDDLGTGQEKDQSREEQVLRVPSDKYIIHEQPFLPAPLPPKPASRFSSLHNFSAFLNPPPAPKRHRRRFYRHHDDGLPEKPVSSASPTTTIITPSFSTASAPRTTHRPSSPYRRPPSQPHHTPYKRLQPVFSTESLASLSLADADTIDPHLPASPREEVLPWEYNTPSQPLRRLSSYDRPRRPQCSVDVARAKAQSLVEKGSRRGGREDDAGRTVKPGRSGSSTVTLDAYIHSTPYNTAIAAPPPSSSTSADFQPQPHPEPPKHLIIARRSSITSITSSFPSFPHPPKHQPRSSPQNPRPSHHRSAPSTDSIFAPIFFSPAETPAAGEAAGWERPVSRSSSFDSVAPPPIRRGPRVIRDEVAQEGKLGTSKERGRGRRWIV